MKPILLVEDNTDDVFFTRRAFKSAALQNPLIVIGDGDSAIDYLKQSLKDEEQTPLPGLVLLDLNLPFKSGLEILDWVRAQQRLRTLAVVALTCSGVTGDVKSALEHGASSILVKPPTAEKLMTLRDDLSLSSEQFAQAAHAKG